MYELWYQLTLNFHLSCALTLLNYRPYLTILVLATETNFENVALYNFSPISIIPDTLQNRWHLRLGHLLKS